MYILYVYKWMELWKSPGKILFMKPERSVTRMRKFFFQWEQMSLNNYDYCCQASYTKVLVPLVKDRLHFLQQGLDYMFSEKIIV